jgi:CRISPR-associated endonuclease/helicase Cas3
VLEHHSAADQGDSAGDDFHPGHVWARLAAENWDAPIVVTTTVQLFESLFARGTSPCRRPHRLARSVIILDEAQALPSHRRLLPDNDTLLKVMRHESHLHRQFVQTTHELEALQLRRRGEHSPLTRLDISAPPGP